MAQLPMDADIIVFAKAPIPGRVKTRLSPPLTSETATTVYAAMLEAVLKRVATMAGRAWLAITPDDATIEARGLTVTPQGDGDLGARLRRVSARVWAKREQSAGCQIIIGTDSPDLPIERFCGSR